MHEVYRTYVRALCLIIFESEWRWPIDPRPNSLPNRQSKWGISDTTGFLGSLLTGPSEHPGEDDLMRSARRAMCSILLILAVLWPASAASAEVVHDKDSWFNRTSTGHDLNICGDLATFTFETRGHSISTETARGFHVTLIENGVYTVDFDDTPRSAPGL